MPDAPTEETTTDSLLLDIDGFEGPLDLLLTLARQQKVDLRHVSILQLAESYLAFIDAARDLRLEIAADYLVTAAWLAYLKSRLLLPPYPADEDAPDADEMAARLAFQLRRLEAMRAAAARLMARDRLGRDVFVRGAPDPITVERQTEWRATLLDLLQGYARCKTKAAYTPLHVERPKIYAMEDALRRLGVTLGTALDWTTLEAFLPDDWREPRLVRSAMASTFAATLELARDGVVALRQEEPFGRIELRRTTS